MLGVSRKAFVLGAPRHAACWLAAAFFFSFVPIRAGERSPSCFFSDFYICRLVASGRFFCCTKKRPPRGLGGAIFRVGCTVPKSSEQGDVLFAADGAGVLVPQARLHLADVRAADHQHAQAGLADAAADREGKFPFEQHFVEGEGAAVVAARDGKLSVEGGAVHADAHRRDFERAAERLVPKEEIAVELPVVVVGRAAAVRLARSQRPADLRDEGGRVLFDEGGLALFGRKFGPAVFKFLRGDEGDLARKGDGDLREFALQRLAHVAHGVHDGAYRRIQKVGAAVLAGDDLLPIPLVDVDGVEIVERLVAADGVHVGIQPFVHLKAVLFERQPLPFGEGVHDLPLLADGGDVEGDGAFGAAQIVVEAGVGGDEEGRGNALQAQRALEFCLEAVFDIADGALQIVAAQRGTVGFGDDDAVHVVTSLWNYNTRRILLSNIMGAAERFFAPLQ